MDKVSSEIKTFKYKNGEIQRVQIVRFGDFEKLQFFKPDYDELSFERLVGLYRDFIVKKYAPVLGKVIIFRLSKDEEIPFTMFDEQLGNLYDKQTAVHLAFQRNIRLHKGQLVFKDEVTENYFKKLQAEGDLAIVEGKLNRLSFLPVGKQMGFMTKSRSDASLKVNSNFFVMDLPDCGSVYDHVGVPIGLSVIKGKILNPPLFDREVLLVGQNGQVVITKINLEQLTVEIDGRVYRHNENCLFYQRPASKRTPFGKMDLVVVNNKVVGCNPKGGSEVPSGGFVIQLNKPVGGLSDLKVSYHGLEDVIFALQVGNSSIVNGQPTMKFISPFYRFYNVLETSFPPSMYPLNFKKARAPRIVLGADENDRGMLLWFEGAGKFGYQPLEGSCGASLYEAAVICQKAGMKNGIHLDGGGSAQILLNNQRSLKVSDRRKDDFAQVERAIPFGLMIE